MAEIRARETTVSIPPWYGTTRTREVDEEDEEELELRWTCDHYDEEIPTETGALQNLRRGVHYRCTGEGPTDWDY